jgi:hypothetical protein
MQHFNRHRATCALALGIVIAPFVCDCFNQDHHPIVVNPPAQYVLVDFAKHADEPPRAPGAPLIAVTTTAVASPRKPLLTDRE